MNTVSQISIDQADQPIATFVFAHGAGAGKDSEFMHDVATMLAKHRIQVVRFNFPYMQKAVELGKKRPPDRGPVLEQAFLDVIAQQETNLPLFIGGKSMGGRIATLILTQSTALGAMCFGYPFHPPGKPEKLRTEHLMDINKPVLVLQGQRDTFGNQQEVTQYPLSTSVDVQFFDDGDHSLKPRKASGLTQQQHIQSAVEQCIGFITRVIEEQE